MDRSWDETINDASDYSHGEWKKRLFMKVIQRRLRYPPTAGVEE